MVRLEIPLRAVPKGRPRSGRQGFFYTPSRTREFEEAFRGYVQDEWRDADVRGIYVKQPLTGRLGVTLEFLPHMTLIEVTRLFPTERAKGVPVGDIDNLGKAVLDACNGILWKDDRQIDFLLAKR